MVPESPLWKGNFQTIPDDDEVNIHFFSVC